jgi:DNA replication and repair protein RecF
MSISRLRISQLRNIQDAELDLSRINLICGANGSGKTSILEAVFILGSGRSFRSTRLDPVINHAAQQCAVHALLKVDTDAYPSSIGVSRDRQGDFAGRIQGEPIRSAAELARRLPVQLINSATFELLEGGPRVRRQFLDWGVFHVEHGFHRLWLDVNRSLRQRNSLLRHARIQPDQLDAWDERLATGAKQLDELRQRYFDAFYPEFSRTLAELIGLDQLDVSYQRGWDRERDLREVLAEQLERDRQRGFTHAGPHRADLRVRIQGMNAAEILSRGQQKLVVSAMKLAQGRLFSATQGRECIFLVDDLPAELDREHRRELCRLLAGIHSQVLLSCVDVAELQGCWDEVAPEAISVFHVEHGRIASSI